MADETTEPKAFPAEAFQNLLNKNNNDALKLASQLFDENFQYRTQIRELKSNLPKEGAVVLSTDDAKEFSTYKQFLTDSKLDLKQITERVGQVETLEIANKELSRAEAEREAAQVTGFKLATFRKLMKDFPDATFEIKTQKDKDQKEAKVAFVRNGDKESPLNEFAKDNFADFLPALKQEPDTPIKQGNTHDPEPHSTTRQDNVKAEIARQLATGRYAL